MPASVPVNAENLRLAALRGYDILDTQPELAFERLTRLGARIFNAPIVLISLVDQSRQWFKSCYGLNTSETGRDVSFCAHAIESDEPLIVNDATIDPRFADNPLVTGTPHIRFYAGAPLITPTGQRLGTFCVIDTEPRAPLAADHLATLRDFAALVIEEMELRKTARELAVTERALRSSEARFHTFMDHSPAIAYIKGQRGRMVYVNKACERILGVPVTDCIGKAGSDIFPGPVTENLSSNDRAAFESPLSALEEVPATSGEMRQFLSFKFPFTDAQDQRLLGGVSIDITEQKRLEQQLIEMNSVLAEQTRRAQEASRLKSEFLANMSHELRTPLNGIIGFGELLADGKAGELNTRQQRFLDNVLVSSRHLLQLINDLLDLAKIEAGKLDLHPEASRSRELIIEVTNSLRPLADAKKISMSAEIGEGVEDIYTDQARFKQIIYNYLSNAIKFTAEKGTIAVRVTTEGTHDIRIDVTDTGIGIDPSNIPRLFQKFEQLDGGPAKKFGGTGLGLALVQKIVHRFGGYVGMPGRS